MYRLTTITKVFCIYFTVLLLSGVVPSQASGKGTFKGLYFPGADAKKCGGWYVASPQDDDSQWVSFERPGLVKYKVIDGTKKVIMEGSQDIFANQAPNVAGLRLPAYGLPNAEWGNAKNPIRVIVTVDGDQVADLTANNPCLPMARPQPVNFDPSDVKVPQEPTDRLIVRCRRNLLYISGKDDKGWLLDLTVLRLKDVIAAGNDGLKKDLRRNGVLLIKVDANGNFNLTWTGGRFNADGQPGSGFAKNFTCAFR
jgi:hypothetical protein